MTDNIGGMKIDVPKLNSHNYRDWAMRLLMESKDLDDIIDGTAVALTDATTLAQHNKKEKQAQATLIFSLEQDQWMHVQQKASVSEV